MNKYQEAFEKICAIKIYEEPKESVDGYVKHSHAQIEYMKEFNIIEELVDKATPKKPIGDKYNERCPACNEDSVRSDFASNYELKRCYECGQALDWNIKE